jgi:apolipoprotein N-acyltransferase
MKLLRVGVSWREGLLALGAGLLGAAAFPPIGLWPLLLVSIAMFLWVLRDKSSSEARSLGLLYGVVYAAGTMYWLFSIFAYMAISLLAIMAAYFGILATLIGLTRDFKPWPRAALVALFAVGIEWLRGDAWYLRFPWYTPPHALAQSQPWIAGAQFLGTYGLSYVVWLFIGAAVFGRPQFGLPILLLPACWFLLPSVEAPTHKALLVQVEEKDADSLLARLPEEPVDLVLFPEYAYYVSPKMILRSKNGPAALARKLRCPVVFGALENQPMIQNVAAVLDEDGQLLGTFTKQRPVPLFRDGEPGTKRPVFPVKQGVFGVAICYDFDAPAVAGSLVGSGATVLVDPTFDAMSWGRVQHVHHELLLRLRAVENDRWIVRAASSGRSEAVDPHGMPSEQGLDIGETGWVTVGYAHRHGVPLGGQLYWFGPGALIASGVVVVVLLFRSRKRVGSENRALSDVSPAASN